MFPLDLVKPFLAENQAFGLLCISILSKSSSSSICVQEHRKWEVAACPSLSLFFKIGSGFLYGSREMKYVSVSIQTVVVYPVLL